MKEPKNKSADVKKFPNKPGVYRFYNREGKLIYVGKAKDLKARVSSYFNDLSGQNRKTRQMVAQIETIEITIVNSEFDALLLENNLIKKNQPKYNILLKDDKSFPFICVMNERFPRIFSVRNPIPGKGKYYGPYTSVRAMKTILELFRDIYTLRTCNLNLSEKNIASGKFKVCLEYHIGKCKAPCVGMQNETDYMREINQAEHILKGHMASVKNYFRQEMTRLAGERDYEEAQRMKEKLQLLDKFQVKTVIVNPDISDVDVFGLVSDAKRSYINYLRIVNGSIVLSKNVEARKKLAESDEEVLGPVAFELRTKYHSISNEIITNVPLTYFENIHHKIPKIGDKKKLVDLAVKNALYYKREKQEQKKPVYRETRVLKTLQEDLRLKNLPEHIECFDNSNLQGSYPVASMVCFLKGRPAKNEYRKYNIKTVTGPDDFASMREIITRRYGRLKREQRTMPDLIVVDGGKGQLSSAVDALKFLGLYGDIPIVGIAKRLEEIYFPGDQFPVHISKKSESLKLLQQLRDEAHRFAITFHRNQRSKGALTSSLTSIDGIGEKTAWKLLKKFHSLKKIKGANKDALAKVVGQAKAEILFKALYNPPGF